MKAETLIFFKKIFTRGFYLRFFDFVIEFFHLEGHSNDLVKENIDFEYSFSFPFSFDLISFMMVQRLVNGGSNNFFFFFFFSWRNWRTIKRQLTSHTFRPPCSRNLSLTWWLSRNSTNLGTLKPFFDTMKTF